MAKFGEGDQRWIVKERADGANVNNWHWTTKNVTSHVTEQLNEGVKGDIFPPDSLMANCRIKSAETSGEASVNNRKGRTFIIYELEMKLKWEGELRDAEGTVLEKGSGSYRLPDVSAESLDDLEIEFETKSRGSSLSEAMRTHGARCVRSSVQNTIKRLQAEVTAEAAAASPHPRRCLPTRRTTCRRRRPHPAAHQSGSRRGSGTQAAASHLLRRHLGLFVEEGRRHHG